MNKNHIFWVDLLGIRGLIFVEFCVECFLCMLLHTTLEV